MDRLTNYRRLIQETISRLAELSNRQHHLTGGGVETYCIFDTDRDHYLLVNLGWANRKRVRATTLHVRLREGKVHIEDDMTEDGIATELMQAGVPKEDIVLAFQPPELRKHTEFAVA